MVHQSPRSSAEYAGLMAKWSEHFTCIAPDTPGFGQSAPLAGEPGIEDFADAIVAFLDAAGLKKVGAYGFHSGAIILIAALERHLQRWPPAATPSGRSRNGSTSAPPICRPSGPRHTANICLGCGTVYSNSRGSFRGTTFVMRHACRWRMP